MMRERWNADLDLPCKFDFVTDVEVDAEVQEISHS